MSEKRQRVIMERSSQFLGQTEKVQMATIATAKGDLVTAATGPGVAGVAGLLLNMNIYVLLTDRRILFVDPGNGRNLPARQLGFLLRNKVTTSTPRSGGFLGMRLVIKLAVEGQEKGVKIGFPVILRQEGRKFAAALSATQQLSNV